MSLPGGVVHDEVALGERPRGREGLAVGRRHRERASLERVGGAGLSAVEDGEDSAGAYRDRTGLRLGDLEAHDRLIADDVQAGHSPLDVDLSDGRRVAAEDDVASGSGAGGPALRVHVQLDEDRPEPRDGGIDCTRARYKALAGPFA